jgi:triosephosphate isomerase
MKYHVVANWKCHKTSADGRRWLDRFARLYKPHTDLQVVVAPTFLSLESLADHLGRLALTNVALAAQDISPFPRGGYTGEIAADMVAGMARYVIIGHNERRRYFHESSQDIVNKVTEAADARLVPIVCVDSASALPLLGALEDVEVDRLVVAYTPVESVNFNIAESPARVGEAVNHIRRMFPRWPVIYGGALLPANVRGYFQLPVLSGVFVGASSLEPEPFAEICALACERL